MGTGHFLCEDIWAMTQKVSAGYAHRHVIVAGPTASGKSALAFWGAGHQPGGRGCIINGDSIQMYQNIPLLSAVPNKHEQAHVPHHLYEFLPSCHQGYHVAAWLQDVHKVLHNTQGPAWVVGGTGLYISSLLKDNLHSIPEIPLGVKQAFRQEWQEQPIQDVRQALMAIDPASAKRLQDRQRMVKALLVAHVTGKTLTWWHHQGQHIRPHSHHQRPLWVRVLVWPSMTVLMQRAEKRWHTMLADGVVDEVRHAYTCIQDHADCQPKRCSHTMAEDIAKGHRSLNAFIGAAKGERNKDDINNVENNCYAHTPSLGCVDTHKSVHGSHICGSSHDVGRPEGFTAPMHQAYMSNSPNHTKTAPTSGMVCDRAYCTQASVPPWTGSGDRSVQDGQEKQPIAGNHHIWQQAKIARAIGFESLVALGQGKISTAECTQRYLRDIHGYIKRQRTWFRTQFAGPADSPLIIVPTAVDHLW